MSGKKPSDVGFAIVRGFRGEMLYLASTHAGNGFRWLAGKQNAMAFTSADEALATSERASREYGAKVTVVDMSPEAHIVERTVTGYTSAAARILQSVVAKRAYPCALCGQQITDGKPCGCGARS